MSCSCQGKNIVTEQIHKIEAEIAEMADTAKKIIKTASDPVSAVVRFLHERPENVSLNGHSVKQVLHDAFGSYEQVPGLVRLLSAHLKEVVRHSNVIAVYNEHFAQDTFAGYMVKLKEQVKFEITRENNKLVLKNIAGLVCVEHGVELPLEKILINPPKLEITVKLGLLRPVKAVDILA